MSQYDTVIGHLAQDGSLSQIEALRLYGVARLAARIEELRNDGFVIRTERRKVTKKDGTKATIAVYHLEAGYARS